MITGQEEIPEEEVESMQVVLAKTVLHRAAVPEQYPEAAEAKNGGLLMIVPPLLQPWK